MKSFIAKSLAAICFLTLAVLAIQARENCAWINAAPRVALNLRLGMTYDATRMVFNKANAALGGNPKVKTKTNGDYRFFQNYINKRPPAHLRGARAMYLRFFDGRLYQMEVFYEKEFAPTLENFTEIVAREYNFPASLWTFEKIEAVIRCGENKLAADYILNPRIELTDEIVLKKVNELNDKK